MPSNLCASSQGCLMQENLYNYWCRLYIECKCGIAVSGINFVVFFSLFFIFIKNKCLKSLLYGVISQMGKVWLIVWKGSVVLNLRLLRILCGTNPWGESWFSHYIWFALNKSICRRYRSYEKGFSTLLRLMMEILVVCSLALQLYIKIWELERSIKFLNIYFFFLFLLSFLSLYFSKVDARKARRKGSILKGVAVVKRLRTTGTCDHKYVSLLGV